MQDSLAVVGPLISRRVKLGSEQSLQGASALLLDRNSKDITTGPKAH